MLSPCPPSRARGSRQGAIAPRCPSLPAGAGEHGQGFGSSGALGALGAGQSRGMSVRGPWLSVPCFSSASMSLDTVGSACSGRAGSSASSACPGCPAVEKKGRRGLEIPACGNTTFLRCPRTGSSCCFGTATTNTLAHACLILEHFSLFFFFYPLFAIRVAVGGSAAC